MRCTFSSAGVYAPRRRMHRLPRAGPALAAWVSKEIPVPIPSSDVGLFEAMYTARSLRHFKPDAVPQELITKVIDPAIRASSGGNTQHWSFIVVRDAEV